MLSDLDLHNLVRSLAILISSLAKIAVKNSENGPRVLSLLSKMLGLLTLHHNFQERFLYGNLAAGEGSGIGGVGGYVVPERKHVIFYSVGSADELVELSGGLCRTCCWGGGEQ